MKNLLLASFLIFGVTACGKNTSGSSSASISSSAAAGPLLFSVLGSSATSGVKNIYGNGYTELVTDLQALGKRGERAMPVYRVSDEVWASTSAHDIFWHVESSFKTLPFCSFNYDGHGLTTSCVVGSTYFKDWREFTVGNGVYDQTKYFAE